MPVPKKYKDSLGQLFKKWKQRNNYSYINVFLKNHRNVIIIVPLLVIQNSNSYKEILFLDSNNFFNVTLIYL